MLHVLGNVRIMLTYLQTKFTEFVFRFFIVLGICCLRYWYQIEGAFLLCFTHDWFVLRWTPENALFIYRDKHLASIPKILTKHTAVYGARIKTGTLKIVPPIGQTIESFRRTEVLKHNITGSEHVNNIKHMETLHPPNEQYLILASNIPSLYH